MVPPPVGRYSVTCTWPPGYVLPATTVPAAWTSRFARPLRGAPPAAGPEAVSVVPLTILSGTDAEPSSPPKYALPSG